VVVPKARRSWINPDVVTNVGRQEGGSLSEMASGSESALVGFVASGGSTSCLSRRGALQPKPP
jgi:hypothetical protein